MFGLDNRSNGNLSQGRSDVIMLANINNDTKEVKLVSVYSILSISSFVFSILLNFDTKKRTTARISSNTISMIKIVLRQKR